MSIYPLCCTAEVPTTIVDKFLKDAHAGSEKLVPNSDYCLGLVTLVNGDASIPTAASRPPVQSLASPFTGQSVQDVSKQLPNVNLFVVLDQQSVNDETALLVFREDGASHTVRVTFDAAQHLLTGLEMATIGFAEIQNIASASGGVYGAQKISPQKGGPAPLMRLGGD